MPILRPADIRPKKLDISVDFPFLNYALGGWPLGKIVLIWGDPSSGKTSFAAKILAIAQKNLDGYALWGDAEWSFDPSWHIDKIGVDPERLYVVRGEYAEEMFGDIRTAYEEITSNNKMCAFLFDSYVSMVTKDEKDKDVLKTKKLAELARLLTIETKLWLNWVAVNDAVGIIINQMRQNIGMYGGAHRNPGAEIKDFVKHLEFRFKAHPKDEKWARYGITPVTMSVTKSKINTIRVGGEHMFLLRHSDGKIMDFWSSIAPPERFYIKIDGSRITDTLNGKTYTFAHIFEDYGDFSNFWKTAIGKIRPLDEESTPNSNVRKKKSSNKKK